MKRSFCSESSAQQGQTAGPHRKWTRSQDQNSVRTASARQSPRTTRVTPGLRNQATGSVNSEQETSANVPTIRAAGGAECGRPAEANSWQTWVADHASNVQNASNLWNAAASEAANICLDRLTKHLGIVSLVNGLDKPDNSTQTVGSIAKLLEAAEVHTSSVKKLAQMQLQRQVSSLCSNTRKAADADEELLISSQHSDALSAVLLPDVVSKPLSVAMICDIHRQLVRGAPLAGCIRRGHGVTRCGATHFMPAAEVAHALKQFVDSLNALSEREELDALGLAAAAHVGLVSIHPFSDGNGRLARILCNWALRKRGVPFTISMCSTDEQRQLYVRAVCECRTMGSLAPFCDLLATLVSRAWLELDRLVVQRNTEALEMQGEALRREARDEAKRTACMICLEADSNIQTLCCGAACHFNCLGQWLQQAGAPACCHCRQPLPRAQIRRHADPSEGAAIDLVSDEENEETHIAAEAARDWSMLFPSLINQIVSNMAATEETEETEESDETTSRDDASFEDEASTTSERADGADSPGGPSPQRRWNGRGEPICSYCNSQPAHACANFCCARCCRDRGPFRCERHG